MDDVQWSEIRAVNEAGGERWAAAGNRGEFGRLTSDLEWYDGRLYQVGTDLFAPGSEGFIDCWQLPAE